jgi:lipoyl(octanoyl) transferase
MKLHVLPVRTAGAAENMATDFLLLQRYPDAQEPRFRHYEWRGPAFTFGFSQKIEFVRDKLAAELPVDLCRRPTGGGIVDHRNDWTYALVIPRGHPLYDERATLSYRAIHDCVARALIELGQAVEVKQQCEPCADAAESAPGAGVCFQRAELYDVVNASTGAKVAGAAQKRNKHGLLFQGSIEKAAVGDIDWEMFGGRFQASVAHILGTSAEARGWPEFGEDELSALIEQYAAPEWNEYR